MKDSISFPLLLATVLAGAFLTVLDPANRMPDSKVAQIETTPATPSALVPPAGTVAGL